MVGTSSVPEIAINKIKKNIFFWRMKEKNTLNMFNGNFRILKWRYLPYIRPIFQAYVRGYTRKIWPYIVLTYLHFRILEISH